MAIFGFKKRTQNNDNSTVLNNNSGSRSTVVNAGAGPTEINAGTVDNRTVVNGGEELFIDIGTKLLGKYVVRKILNDDSGEAELFLCEYENGTYVAKVYRRAGAIKKEVAQKLLSLNSPYIAKIYEFGDFGGYPVEVLPYYEKGNLAGRKYSMDELKKRIIPQLNEALHVLHGNDIIHKDIKPSNIMLTKNNDLALIDFGISSVREGGATVIATVTGMTPDYTAPEALKGLFLSESDYYSLGITIYELFTGATPYARMSGEEIERMLIVQKIPLPADMPKELQDLISALTYHDITNRRDKGNPNRRWTYEEVKAWCAGKKQIVPGSSTARQAYDDVEPIRFKKKEYFAMEDLISAFAVNWEDAKRFFFEGDLSYGVKRNDPDLARKLRRIEDEADDDPKLDKDMLFFKMLYVLDSHLTKFIWKGHVWDSLTDLGRDYAKKLAANDNSMNSLMNELLNKKVISAYLEALGDTDKVRRDAIAAHESRKIALGGSGRDEQVYMWSLAYMLSGEKVLRISGREFREPNDISVYMLELLNRSRKAFEDFCGMLLPDGETLNMQLESWLIALGYSEQIEKWRESLLFE